MNLLMWLEKQGLNLWGSLYWQKHILLQKTASFSYIKIIFNLGLLLKESSVYDFLKKIMFMFMCVALAF